MPNLTGVSAMPRLRIGLVALNAAIALPAAPVVATCLQFLDQPMDHVVVLDGLAVGRDVAAAAVEIGLAHIERIEPELPGDRVHHALDREHALRPAEAAEGGVGDGVGLARASRRSGTTGGNRHCRHGTSRGRRRRRDRSAEQPQRAASSTSTAAHAPSRIEADRPVDAEIVALAGHHHVVVAVEPELARPAGGVRRERGEHGPLRRLAFLAAEAAAHAPHLARSHRRRRRPSTRATMCWTSVGCWVERIDQHVMRPRPAPRARPGLRDRSAPGRRCGSRPASRCGAPGDHRVGVAAAERVVGQHACRRTPAPPRP